MPIATLILIYVHKCMLQVMQLLQTILNFEV